MFSFYLKEIIRSWQTPGIYTVSACVVELKKIQKIWKSGQNWNRMGKDRLIYQCPPAYNFGSNVFKAYLKYILGNKFVVRMNFLA